MSDNRFFFYPLVAVVCAVLSMFQPVETSQTLFTPTIDQVQVAVAEMLR